MSLFMLLFTAVILFCQSPVLSVEMCVGRDIRPVRWLKNMYNYNGIICLMVRLPYQNTESAIYS